MTVKLALDECPRVSDALQLTVVGPQEKRLPEAGVQVTVRLPSTASVAHRLAWATAVAVGPSVRSIVIGDRVLFDPDDRSEVELHGRDYILLRERDVHAVAAQRVEPDATGLYL